MSERVFERVNQRYGAKRSRVHRPSPRSNRTRGHGAPVSERVFERANQRDGAEGSLVHQARTLDDLLLGGMVQQ